LLDDLALAEGEPKYDAFEKHLAEGLINVPTSTPQGDFNGAPYPEPAAYLGKFLGSDESRIIAGGIGAISRRGIRSLRQGDQRRTGFDVSRGERIFHLRFGDGRITYIRGNKLTVDYDKAGEKKVRSRRVEGVRYEERGGSDGGKEERHVNNAHRFLDRKAKEYAMGCGISCWSGGSNRIFQSSRCNKRLDFGHK